MPQITSTHNPCPECRPVFEGQRSHYCRELLRYQRENFSQRTEINSLEVQLKRALEKLLKAERELIQSWKTSQRTWVGLEIEEVQDSYNSDYQAQTRAVEAKLKERNTTHEAPKCSQA
jgi:hypothetical protein